MRFGLVIDHTMLQKHMRETNVVDREAAARSSMIISMIELDEVLEQRVASPAQVEEIVDILRLLILRLRAVLVLECADQGLKARKRSRRDAALSGGFSWVSQGSITRKFCPVLLCFSPNKGGTTGVGFVLAFYRITFVHQDLLSSGYLSLGT